MTTITRTASPVSGPIGRSLLAIAVPAMTALFMEMLFSLIDIFWIGYLGTEALAAIGGISFLIWAIFSIGEILSTGAHAYVSRCYGALKFENAREFALFGMISSVIIAGILTGILFLTRERIFLAIGYSGEVTHLADEYFFIFLIGLPFMFLFMVGEAVFRASGDAKSPMKILGVTLFLNAFLDPLLIFGYGPVPAWGIKGAAAATVFAHVIAAGWVIVLARRKGLVSRSMTVIPAWADQTVNLLPEEPPPPGIATLSAGFSARLLASTWRMLLIGLPRGLTGFSFSLVYLAVARILLVFGEAPIAALGICHRIESIAFLSCVGFSVAAATMIGQNLGARLPERGEKAAWISLVYASIVLLVYSVITAVFAPEIISLFSRDPEVLAAGASYLRILALLEVFLAFEIVLDGAFSGAGNTLPPMAISLPFTALRIPISYFVAVHLGMGVEAVWWTIAVTTMIKGVLTAAWFMRGRWKGHRLQGA